MINHIVLFKLKSNISSQDKNTLQKEFFNLKNKISEIISVSGGDNISIEKLDQGFNKGYSLFFKDLISLRSYLISKAHKSFVKKYVNSFVDDVIVFDYKVIDNSFIK